jgi:hypothetical protein
MRCSQNRSGTISEASQSCSRAKEVKSVPIDDDRNADWLHKREGEENQTSNEDAETPAAPHGQKQYVKTVCDRRLRFNSQRAATQRMEGSY